VKLSLKNNGDMALGEEEENDDEMMR